MMASRILLILTFILLALLAACAGAGGGTTLPGTAPAKPLMDTRLPAVIETATFAFG